MRISDWSSDVCSSDLGVWVVFLPEGGDRARLWSVLINQGEISHNGQLRTFDLHPSDLLGDLNKRLEIGWRWPRTYRINAPTAAADPEKETADTVPARPPRYGHPHLESPTFPARNT